MAPGVRIPHPPPILIYNLMTMYICVCNAITEDDIKTDLKENGLWHVLTNTKAASCCGICLEDIYKLNDDMIKEQK